MQERKGESGDAKGASKQKDATLAVAADVDLEACDLERRDVVVVGGGSTAFTLAAAASRRGAARVTVVSRGEVTVRDRECDVAFYGNKGIGAFRGAPHPETRVASLRAETRASADERTFAAAADAGVAVLEGRVVERATRCETTGKWRLLVAARCRTRRRRAGSRRRRHRRPRRGFRLGGVRRSRRRPEGSRPEEPVRPRRLRRAIVGGFPVLVEDDDASDASDAPGTAKDGKGAASPEAIGPLRWPGLPLYFVGRYASLSVGPAAGAPAGHRVAARAVALAVRAHAARWRRGQNPYAQGLSAAQTKGSAQTTTRQTDAEGVPLALRLVPEHLRGGRSLMDARELARALRGAADGPSPRGKGGLLVPSSSADTLAMRDLAQYQTIDDDFVLEVRLPLPERVPPEKVRVAFEARSVEVFAIETRSPTVLRPQAVRARARGAVPVRGGQIGEARVAFLHKYDNNEWRFLKGKKRKRTSRAESQCNSQWAAMKNVPPRFQGMTRSGAPRPWRDERARRPVGGARRRPDGGTSETPAVTGCHPPERISLRVKRFGHRTVRRAPRTTFTTVPKRRARGCVVNRMRIPLKRLRDGACRQPPVPSGFPSPASRGMQTPRGYASAR